MTDPLVSYRFASPGQRWRRSTRSVLPLSLRAVGQAPSSPRGPAHGVAAGVGERPESVGASREPCERTLNGARDGCRREPGRLSCENTIFNPQVLALAPLWSEFIGTYPRKEPPTPGAPFLVQSTGFSAAKGPP